MDTKIIIYAEGGVAQDVFSNAPVKCLIVDMDVHKIDADYEPERLDSTVYQLLLNNVFASPDQAVSILTKGY